MGTTKPAYMASYDKPNAVSGSPEGGEVPVNTFKTKEPLEATIKSVERIVGPNATGETCHIVIETEGKIPFWEGQSYGIVPPGEKEMPNGKTKPHAPRLYSIASSREQQNKDGGKMYIQGHRVGHLPEGPQEERAVPRGGVLRRPPWREACDSRRARRHLSIRTDTHS